MGELGAIRKVVRGVTSSIPQDMISAGLPLATPRVGVSG